MPRVLVGLVLSLVRVRTKGTLPFWSVGSHGSRLGLRFMDPRVTSF